MRLLAMPWADDEIALATDLPGDVGAMARESVSTSDVSWMDAETWFEVHGHLLHNFVLGDPGWESLAFRLWLHRVLAYTTDQASIGYDQAMAYLEDTIRSYEERSLTPATANAPAPSE